MPEGFYDESDMLGGAAVAPPPEEERSWTPESINDAMSQMSFSSGKEPESPGIFSTAVRGALKGVNDIRGLGDFALAMGANVLGLDGVEDSAINSYLDRMQDNWELTQGTPERIEDIGNVGDAARWGLFTISSQIPLFAVGGAGAGLGRLAGGRLAMSAFDKMVKDVGLEEANKMVAKRVAIKKMLDASGGEMAAQQAYKEIGSQSGQMFGATAALYPINAGDVGSGVYEQTGEVRPDLGLGLGIPMSGLDALPEVRILQNIFGPRKANQVVKGLASRIGEGGVKQAFLEGGTEGLQGVIENIAVNIADPKQPVFSGDGLSNIVNSIVGGAVAGFVPGAAEGAFNRLAPGGHTSAEVNQRQSDIETRASEISGEDLSKAAEEEESNANLDEQISNLETQLDSDIPEEEKASIRSQLEPLYKQQIAAAEQQREQSERAKEDIAKANLGEAPFRQPRKPERITSQQQTLERSIAENNARKNIQTALESLQGPRGVMVSPEHKNALQGILEPYAAILGEEGVRIVPRKKNDASLRLGMDFDSEGNITYFLPHADKGQFTQSSPELNEYRGMEEIAHVAQIADVRSKGKKKGLTGKSLGSYMNQELLRQDAGLRMSYGPIVQRVWDAYTGTEGTKPNFAPGKLSMEFGRMLIQHSRTGKITEDLRALDEIRRNGSQPDQVEAESVMGKILSGLRRIRDSIARFYYHKTAPKAFREWNNSVQRTLDKYGYLLPRKESQESAPTNPQQTQENESTQSTATQSEQTTADQHSENEDAGTQEGQSEEQQRSSRQESEGGELNASENEKATEVHGNVQQLQGEEKSARQVPAPESSQGIPNNENKVVRPPSFPREESSVIADNNEDGEARFAEGRSLDDALSSLTNTVGGGLENTGPGTYKATIRYSVSQKGSPEETRTRDIYVQANSPEEAVERARSTNEYARIKQVSSSPIQDEGAMLSIPASPRFEQGPELRTTRQASISRARDIAGAVASMQMPKAKPRMEVTRTRPWAENFNLAFHNVKLDRKTWGAIADFFNSYAQNQRGILGAAEDLIKGDVNLTPDEQVMARGIASRELADMSAELNNRAEPTDRTLEDLDRISSLWERVTTAMVSDVADQARAVRSVGLLQKIYGKEQMVKEYADNAIQSLAKAITISPEDTPQKWARRLSNSLSNLAIKHTDGVFTDEEFAKMVKGALVLMQRNPEKYRKSLRRTVSMNLDRIPGARELERIIFEAIDAQYEPGSDKYFEAMKNSLLRKISNAVPDKKRKQENVNKVLNSAINTAARQYLIESEIIKPNETGEKVPTIQKISLLLQNPARWNDLMDAIGNEVAKQYDGGKDNVTYKSWEKNTLKAMRDTAYTQDMIQSAVNEAKKKLGISTKLSINNTWGVGEEDQGKIVQYFRDSLKDQLPQSEIDKLVLNVGNWLEAETLKRYLRAFGVTTDENGEVKTIRGMKKISEIIKDENFMRSVAKQVTGNANMQKQMDTLTKITKLSMKTRNDLVSTLAKEWAIKMGIPEELAAPIQAKFEQSLSAYLTRANANQNRQLAEQLDQLESAVAATGVSRERAKIQVEKLIEMAAQGFLNDGVQYERVRKLFPSKGLPEYSPEFVEKLKEIGQIIESLPDGPIKNQAILQGQRMVQEREKLTPWEMVTTTMYFNMLSNPETFLVVNPGSNFVSLISDGVIRAASNPDKIGEILSGILDSHKIGVADFKHVMKHGLRVDSNELVKTLLPTETVNPELNPKAHVFFTKFGPRLLHRFLGATDAYFKRISNGMLRGASGVRQYTPEQRADAETKAREWLEQSGHAGDLGVDVSDSFVRIAAQEILDSEWIDSAQTSKEIGQRLTILRNIDHEANRNTFTQQPEGFGGVLAGKMSALTADFPALKPFIPFTHVVGNVLNYQLNWTPWGIVRYKGWSGSNWTARSRESTKKSNIPAWMVADADGNPVKDTALLYKSVAGSAALIGVGLLAASNLDDDDPAFMITGPGPKDPNIRRVWYENGWRPYSLKVGKTYLNYLYTPSALGLAAIGTVMDGIRSDDSPEGLADLFTRSAAATFNAISSQSFLSSIQDIFAAASSDDPAKGLSRAIGNTASSITTPGFFKFWDRILDPQIFSANDALGYVARNTPVINALTLDPMYNDFGEVVTRKGVPGLQRFVTLQGSDSAWKFMQDNGLKLSPFSQTAILGDSPMTPDQKLRYIRESGPRIKAALLQNLGFLQTLTKEEMQDWLSKTASDIRRQVRAEMQFP